MPIYSYRDPQGNVVEMQMSVAEKERCEKDGIIVLNGLEYRRDIISDHESVYHRFNGELISESMGVPIAQVEEARALDRKMGLASEYLPDGRIKWDNLHERRKWLHAHRYVDKDSYI